MKEKIEAMAPYQLPQMMTENVKELEDLLACKRKENAALPKGMIYVSSGREKAQFYLADSLSKSHKSYLSRVLDGVACRYIQQEYNEKIIKTLEWEISWLKNYLKKAEKRGISAIPGLMCKSKKMFYEPVTLPDEEYISEWLNKRYQPKEFLQGDALYETSSGLRVRSKSEIMIAEALEKENVPFRYEYPVEVRGRTLYPDFYCLNVRTREVFIWEHFGMLDEKSYVSTMLEKIAAYEERGFILGKDVIVTGETLEHPLSPKSIECKIASFLK